MHADTTSASDGVATTMWTRQQDKLLEMLVCRLYPRWDSIAAYLGDKTPAQACQRYECVVAELRHVLQAPVVETPPEWDQQEAAAVGEDAAGAASSTTGGEVLEERGKKRKRDGKRNKSVNWTTEEHRQFLEGLKKHGKGKWKALAQEFVKTKSPTQIASHFQKFAIRQDKKQLKLCKRASIHDINDPDIILVVANNPSVAADHDDLGEEEPSVTMTDKSAD